MRYWNLLILSLAINSCNIETTPVNNFDYKELTKIKTDNLVYSTCLYKFFDISKNLSLKLSKEEQTNSLSQPSNKQKEFICSFFCDCSTGTLLNEEIQIPGECTTNEKHLDNNIHLLAEAIRKFIGYSVTHFEEQAKNLDALKKENIENKIKILEAKIRKLTLEEQLKDKTVSEEQTEKLKKQIKNDTVFLEDPVNMKELELDLNKGITDLKTELEEVRTNLKINSNPIIKNNIEAFCKLSKYLKQYLEQTKYDKVPDLVVINDFYHRLLPILYNIHIENMFRDKRHHVSRDCVNSLSFVTLLQNRG